MDVPYLHSWSWYNGNDRGITELDHDLAPEAVVGHNARVGLEALQVRGGVTTTAPVAKLVSIPTVYF